MTKRTRFFIMLGYLLLATILLILVNCEVFDILPAQASSLNVAYVIVFCQFMLFINFDIINEYESTGVNIAKIAIYILSLGTIIILGGMEIISYLDLGLAKSIKPDTAWSMALSGGWANIGLITFIIFRRLGEESMPEGYLPFAAPVATLGGYLLQVIISWLGGVLGAFYFLALITEIALVAIFVVKGWLMQGVELCYNYISYEELRETMNSVAEERAKEKRDEPKSYFTPEQVAASKRALAEIERKTEVLNRWNEREQSDADLEKDIKKYIVKYYFFYRFPVSTRGYDVTWDVGGLKLHFINTDPGKILISGTMNFSTHAKTFYTQAQFNDYAEACADLTRSVQQALLKETKEMVENHYRNAPAHVGRNWNVQVKITCQVGKK